VFLSFRISSQQNLSLHAHNLHPTAEITATCLLLASTRILLLPVSVSCREP
jgi:hypothetical protein